MIIVPRAESELFLTFGAKGDGPASSMRLASSPLVFGHTFLVRDSWPISDSEDEPSRWLSNRGSDTEDDGDEVEEKEGECAFGLRGLE